MNTKSRFHLSLGALSRYKKRSVAKQLAYIFGICLIDPWSRKRHNYSGRHDVIFTHLEGFTGSAADFAFLLDSFETRKNSRVGYEFDLSLPVELTPEDRKEIILAIAQTLRKEWGVAVACSEHAPSYGSERNTHAHFVFSSRTLANNQLGEKVRALSAKKSGPAQIFLLREICSREISRVLEKAGFGEATTEWSHLCLHKRGIDREPCQYIPRSTFRMLTPMLHKQYEEEKDLETKRRLENIERMLSGKLSGPDVPNLGP